MGRVRPHPLLEKLQEWPGEKSEVCAEVIAKLKSSKDLADELIGYVRRAASPAMQLHVINFCTLSVSPNARSLQVPCGMEAHGARRG